MSMCKMLSHFHTISSRKLNVHSQTCDKKCTLLAVIYGWCSDLQDNISRRSLLNYKSHPYLFPSPVYPFYNCVLTCYYFMFVSKCGFHLLQGIRAQIDRDEYRSNMQEEISKITGLKVVEDSVEDVLFQPASFPSGRRVAGVCLGMLHFGTSLCCKLHALCVVI